MYFRVHVYICAIPVHPSIPGAESLQVPAIERPSYSAMYNSCINDDNTYKNTVNNNNVNTTNNTLMRNTLPLLTIIEITRITLIITITSTNIGGHL